MLVTYYEGEEIPKAAKEGLDWAKREILDQAPKHTNVWLAGGALLSHFTRTEISDYDLFFSGEPHLDAMNGLLAKQGYQQVYDNSNVITVQHPHTGVTIDLVKKYYSSLEATLEDFDFTICRVGATKDYICFDENFFMDAARKEIVVQATDRPMWTLKRIHKYQAKGYTISDVELVNVCKQLADLNFNEIEEQMEKNAEVMGEPIITSYDALTGVNQVIPMGPVIPMIRNTQMIRPLPVKKSQSKIKKIFSNIKVAESEGWY